jgi:hypothetical protein
MTNPLPEHPPTSAPLLLQAIWPLVRTFGLSDNLERAAALRHAPTEQLQGLVDSIDPVMFALINQYLDETGNAEEACPYGDLAQAAMEAKQDLAARGIPTGKAVSMFDNVRIVSNEWTSRIGYADREGVCFGTTTPSVTGVEVIGSSEEDVALNVHFEDPTLLDAWFSPDLVVLVDHGAGTHIRVGAVSLVRDANGGWSPPTSAD